MSDGCHHIGGIHEGEGFRWFQSVIVFAVREEAKYGDVEASLRICCAEQASVLVLGDDFLDLETLHVEVDVRDKKRISKC